MAFHLRASCIPVQFCNAFYWCRSFSVIQGARAQISTDASNFTPLTKYYYGDKIKEDGMDGARSTLRDESMILVRKPKAKKKG
jgi:hypothetical protein